MTSIEELKEPMSFGKHRGIPLVGSTFVFDDGSINFHMRFCVEGQDCNAYPRREGDHQECRETAIQAIDAILDMDDDAFDRIFYTAGVYSIRPAVFIGFRQPK